MPRASGSSADDIQYGNSGSMLIIDCISRKLVRRVVHQMFIQSNIHERVEIIEELFSSFESLVAIEPMRIPKSNDESLKYEEFGNQANSKGNCNEALFLYNKSIAFAKKDYQHLYSLYETRANALCKLKLFKASLHSFELAIKYCPSDDLKAECDKRKADFIRDYTACLTEEESIKSECQTDIDSLTRIKDDRKHPNVPFITNCLELNDIKHYGRGITTNSDLNPGEVIAIDRAYVSILYSSMQYRYCSNCLKENWSLIPCPDCTTAMYCNEKCLQIAWKKFHKHECKISNYLMKIFPVNCLMFFRAPLQTIELFGGIGPLIEFEKTFQHIDITSINVFNVSHDDDGEVTNYTDNENFNSRMTVTNYYPVHGLIKDLQEPSNWTIGTYLQTAVSTFLIYRLFHDIFNITTDIQKRFAEMFIHRHILGALMFNYGLYAGSGRKEDGVYGVAIYPFASLINHSCAPNIILDRNGSSGTIFVMHPIKAGEQLFNYYGPHYLGVTKLQRQIQLKSTWNFTCQCTACTEDYQLLHNFPTFCIPLEPNEVQRIAPTNLKLKQLIEYIKALFMFRRSHLPMSPCLEIGYYEYDVTEYLRQLARRLSGSIYMNC